ncbi:hypothetical protein FHG87_018419 [Trinorchestia longiramus]|nr:hypothetical protein FHG87_018419 [Trinorchestia longiramus]
MVYHCCGFEFLNATGDMGHPSCVEVTNESGELCCPNAEKESDCCINEDECKCKPCKPILLEAVHKGFKAVGGVGLFFSFTEFLGVWLTVRYRNQRDPVANPSAFL